MQEIKIIIEKLKKIDKLEFVLKLEKGIYAIVGNNGAGKSSLITCIAKLVRPSILKEEFSGTTNNFSEATITYINPYGFEAIWKKNPTWQASDTYSSMPKYKGFFESSILTGTRFFHLDNKNIKKTMDYIINGRETSFFDKLRYSEIEYIISIENYTNIF